MDTQEQDFLPLLPSFVSHSEFLALLKLMDDEDIDILEQLRCKLVSYGRLIAPALRWLTKEHQNQFVRSITGDALSRIQMEAFSELLLMIRENEAFEKPINLEQMLIAISRFGYPEIDSVDISPKLDEMALRVHQHFIKSHQPTELNLLLCINRVFFEEEEFIGVTTENYYLPENSFVHHVLKTKAGIPISLSCLYILVAERAGVTLHGIGMPAHFLVYHPELDIYIDTFKNGVFLTHNDCKQFIINSGFVYDPTMLEKVSHLAILLRFIRNLLFAYKKIYTLGHWELDMLEKLSHAIVEVMNQGDNDYGESDTNISGER